MFEKLRKLAISRELRTTKSSFAERFAFFRHETKRTECLERLEKYVGDLKNVTSQVELRPKTDANDAAHNLQQKGKSGGTPPSVDLRHLIANLHPVFQEHYCCCACQKNHEVKLCLRDAYKSVDLCPSLDVDFLFSKDFSSHPAQDSRWQEGSVLITSQWKVCSISRQPYNC